MIFSRTLLFALSISSLPGHFSYAMDTKNTSVEQLLINTSQNIQHATFRNQYQTHKNNDSKALLAAAIQQHGDHALVHPGDITGDAKGNFTINVKHDAIKHTGSHSDTKNSGPVLLHQQKAKNHF